MQGYDPYGGTHQDNITSATVVNTGFGVCATVSVIVAGSGNGAVHDCATTGAAVAGNKILVIPQTVGPINMRAYPFVLGLCIVPGTGQTISVAYS